MNKSLPKEAKIKWKSSSLNIEQESTQNLIFYIVKRQQMKGEVAG